MNLQVQHKRLLGGVRVAAHVALVGLGVAVLQYMRVIVRAVLEELVTIRTRPVYALLAVGEQKLLT